MSDFQSINMHGVDRAELARLTKEYDAGNNAQNRRELEIAQDNTGFKPSGRVTIRDGQMVEESFGVQRAYASDIRSGVGILSSASSQGGRPLSPSEITADSIVSVNGMTMTVSMAQKLGVIDTDSRGRYVEVGSPTGPFDGTTARGPGVPPGTASSLAATSVTPDTSERTSGDTPGDGEGALEGLDGDTESVIADLATSMHPNTQAKVVAKVSSALDVDAYVLGDVMAAKGVGMEEAQRIVDAVVLPMKAQADSSVTAEGVPDAEEFFDWAKVHRKTALQAAVRSQMEDRSTAGYRSLAREYVSSLDTIRTAEVMDAAKAAGIRCHTHNGRVVMDIPGTGEVTYAQAVRLGLFKVSRA